MAVQTLDTEKAAAFEEKVVGILNGGGLALMISIGHRTGLFDAMEGIGAGDSETIARAANLNERYTREWLSAMTVGGIVEYDLETGAYRLPPEHAACLTRAATPNNLAAMTQNIGVLGSVEDQIVECFYKGGGVPYSAFHRFHEVMAEDSGQTVLPALIDEILPLAPGLIDKLREGIDVLDLGCGRGKALNLMARSFPNSRFTGYEISKEAIDYANREAEDHASDNVVFELQDAASVDTVEAFDLICTFDAVHDQADPARVLANIHRALRADGVYLMQDIKASSHLHNNMDHPHAPVLYTVSCMHCMTVSLAEGGAGLGTMWGVETAQAMLKGAGFKRIDMKELEHDPFNAYFVCGK